MNMVESMLFLVMTIEFILGAIMFIAAIFVLFYNKEKKTPLKFIIEKYKNLAKALLMLIISLVYKMSIIVVAHGIFSLSLIKIISLIFSYIFLSLSITFIYKQYKER